MWDEYNEFISRCYFNEKHWVGWNSEAAVFEVMIDESRCSHYRKTGTVCDLCFNTALVEKLKILTSLERLDFVNFQLNKYDDPLDWLKRFRAFLEDNEENFGSYKIQKHFLKIAIQGIQQLSSDEQQSDEI